MSKFVGLIAGGAATGSAGGALAGYLGSEQIAKAMMSEPGRKFVRALVSDPSRSTWRRLTTLVGTAYPPARDRSPQLESFSDGLQPGPDE